jgi:hypothetical protein
MLNSLLIGPWKLVFNALDSAASHYICDRVKPKIGAVLRCDLWGGHADHTGIYVGGGKIVELQGNGRIACVSPDEFMSSPCGTAISIYAACDSDARILTSRKIADRAKQMRGYRREYNFLLDNCHQFTAGCITGDFENSNNFLWMLESVIEDELNNGGNICWRVCDF